MTQGQMVKAYLAIGELTREKWPVKTAYALLKLKAKLDIAWKFQQWQEQKLITEHGGEVLPDGRIQFETAEKRKRFEDAIAEVNGMESDIDVSPVALAAPDGLTISPDTLGNLEGFIEFTEGVGGNG